MTQECVGFVFCYWIPDEDGDPVEADRDETFIIAEDAVLKRIAFFLAHRLDLLRKISCFDPPLEIHLYHGQSFKDVQDQHYFYGRVTFDGDQRIMELAVEEIFRTGEGFGEVLDIVAHELMHVLDYLDDKNGVLPGWKEGEITLFRAARHEERRAIMKGQSLLHRYALNSDEEFLAVLGEVFFTRAPALQKTSPVLFGLMNSYFKYTPEAPAGS